MVSIPAATVDEYLSKLPDDRREVVATVRRMVKRHLPKGYVERANWGMICYEVPLAETGPTYNGQPLCFAGIAAQKNHYALYLMPAYMNPVVLARLQSAFERAGKRLDMGKSCIRFKSLDGLPLEELGAVIASVPMEKFIAHYTAVHPGPKAGRPRQAKKSTAKRAKATRKRT